MGVSVDWGRMAFTMDSKLNRAVNECFVRMWDEGLIYRDNRLVNWSCFLKTAISDIEVDFREFEESTRISVPNHEGHYEFGVIHSFAYKLKDSQDEIIVATTRLETMLGDTAVAVHPDDPRYQHFIGKALQHPFIPERELRVIADKITVDMNFGTGAVKITPAHDYNDFDCGQRNNLEKVSVFTEDGRIAPGTGNYSGMMRFDCRNQIETDLKELGLYRGKENNKMRLGFCSRSKDVIEPFLKPQWWVRCEALAARACAVVRSGELTLVPASYEKTWFQWLENIKDWCISRQLWWGHRCPAYSIALRDSAGKEYEGLGELWVAARDLEEARAKAEQHRRAPEDSIEVEQDEDVLDTWFSSGLFPFSALGWPNEEDPDFCGFYPGTLLETGYDILFFWVARMVMMGLYCTGKLPFQTVYLHAMVRDAEGEKMSKSNGNVIDPYEVIDGTTLDNLVFKVKESLLTNARKALYIEKLKKEFPKGIQPCGADALRFGLLSYTIQGRNINLNVKRIEGYRMFCNKLWNAFKFGTGVLQGLEPDGAFLEPRGRMLQNQWILSRLNYAIESVNAQFASYVFGEAVQTIYAFWLNEFCDVYLESIKPVIRGEDKALIRETQNTMFHCLEKGLLLLHPMMPFLTEELYQRLPEFTWKAESISIAQYPVALPSLHDEQAENTMITLNDTVHSARSIFANLNLFGKKPVIFIRSSEETRGLLEPHLWLVETLAKAGAVSYVEDPPAGCLMNATRDTEIYLQLAGMVNIEAEINKLEKKQTQVTKYIEGTRGKMDKPGYAEKTPPHVKEEFEKRLHSSLEDLNVLTTEIEKLRSLI